MIRSCALKVFLLACTALLVSCNETPDHQPNVFDGKWVDLTHEFSNETLYWPTSETFAKDTVAVGFMEAGFYYESYKITTAEHGGTHLDAPVHFAEGKPSTEQIPVERLVGPGVVIDVSTDALENRDYLISVSDLMKWEEQNGPIPNDSIVLLYTGYSRFWPDAERYMGTTVRGQEGVALLHFPGLDPDAAQWLIDNRRIDAIGIDTPSIDYGQSTTFSTHVTLFMAEIPAFENVANLDQLPATGSFVVALPMKIKGGSGGPLRIVANVPEE